MTRNRRRRLLLLDNTLRCAILCLVCTAVAAVVVLLHIRSYTTLSPIDELQHIDYLDQASRFDLVRSGERVGELAMRAEACRKVDSPGFVTPACKAPDLSPEQFQELGINTASTHPPLYYALTGLAARGLVALPGFDDFVAAGRALGTIWLGFGLALTYVLSRWAGAQRLAAGGAVLLLGSSPAVIHSTAVVTNDAPALVAGAGVLLAGIAYAHRRLSLPWLLLCIALGTAIKVTNIVAVGAVCLLLLLTQNAHADRGGVVPGPAGRLGNRYGVAALVALTGLLPPLVWSLVVAHTAVPNAPEAPMDAQFSVDGIGAADLMNNVLAVVSPIQGPYVPSVLQNNLVTFMIPLLNLLIISALVGAAWFAGSSDRVGRLAISTLLAMLAAGPFFVILVYVFASDYIPIPARYGLSLMPAATAVLAAVASKRRGASAALFALGLLSLSGVVGALA